MKPVPRHVGDARFARVARLAAALLAAAIACRNSAPTVAELRVSPADQAFLDTLSRRTFDFFWETTNARNGLTPDRWPTKSFSSIAAVGFALTAYPIGVEHGWVSRDAARERVVTTLRFFWNAPQGDASAGMTGNHGFFYHFLDIDTGQRFDRVELSTIDTSLLLAGILACRSYFDRNDAGETEVRALADSIYARVDWQWARDGGVVVTMGWRPEPAPDENERGFIRSNWLGYDEAMILYVLALGSPTHAIDPAAWTEWTRTYKWDRFQGQDYVQFGPLFGHQYSHLWIDFRGIQDAYMRQRGIDYFENSRRATLAHRAYAISNPAGWRGYDANHWGLTASDGPLDSTLTIDGRARTFHTYWARGVATTESNDDGTLAPTAAGGSVPFAPEVAIPALVAIRQTYGDAVFSRYGFVDAFNPTLRNAGQPVRQGRIVDGVGWFDTDYLGIDQGPILGMIANWRSGFVWNLVKKDPAIVRGLCRAGFTGGWLSGRC